MREDLDRIHSETERVAFIEKVERLRAEGLTYQDIADRFGLSRSAVAERVRKYKRKQRHQG
jgi:DNA-directed RNA polymerase specialized sigma24 family protein